MVGFFQPAAASGGAKLSRCTQAILLGLIGAFLTAFAPAAEVSTTLEPRTVPAGEAARLTIKIQNGTVTSLQTPQVPNLILRGPSQGRQTSIINGVRTSTTTLTWAAGSMSAGTYNIPAFTLVVDGAQVQTTPVTLTVTPSANQNPQGLPEGAPGQPAPDQGDDAPGFLTVELAGNDRSHAWVGEIAPVRIKAWLPADTRVSLTTPLQPEGSSFTLHHLSPRPHQEVEEHNGKRYLTVTWFGGLSATKAGSSPPNLSMKISVEVPDPASRNQRTGDPFFDRFLTRTIPKEVVLQTSSDQTANIEVRPLPTEGRPADFDGAVGKFGFGAVQIPATWKTGEPQGITAEITGEGNFQLLRQPALTSEHEWKSYPGQSTFTPGDAASFSGTSRFAFNAVPRKSGTFPAQLSFSYFDPVEGTYQTAVSTPLGIEVTGTDLPPESENPVAASPPAPTPAPPPPTMAPQRPNMGISFSLQPPAFRPIFPIFLTICALSLTAGIFWRILHRHRTDPTRLARTAFAHNLQQARRETESLAARGEVSGFFAAARRLLQLHLSQLWQRPAHSITLADVSRRLAPDSPVVLFFQEADRQEFSRKTTLAAADLPEWKRRLDQAVASLPRSGNSAGPLPEATSATFRPA